MNMEQPLTKHEFNLLHKVIDLAQTQKRQVAVPAVRRDVLENSLQSLLKEQGLEIKQEDAIKILNDKIQDEMPSEISEINIPQLLGSQKQQEEEIVKFLNNPKVKNDATNLLGFIIKKPANMVLLKSLSESNLLKTKIPSFFKTFLYYYSISDHNLIKKTKVLNTLKTCILVNTSLLMPFLLKLITAPSFYVSGSGLLAGSILGGTLCFSLLILISQYLKIKRNKVILLDIDLDIIKSILKSQLYAESIGKLKLASYHHDDLSPNNFETQELLKFISKDLIGASILKNLVDNKHKLTVFDIGIMGAAFLDLNKNDECNDDDDWYFDNFDNYHEFD